MIATAPGKVMLAGEYAVLDGAPAVASPEELVELLQDNVHLLNQLAALSHRLGR